MDKVCRDFMNHKCSRNPCNYIHDKNLCYGFWKGGACKWGADCKKNHFVSEEGGNYSGGHKKNTTEFEPNYEQCDMRVIVDTSQTKFSKDIQTRDVVFIPDFIQGPMIYEKLVDEMVKCGGEIFKLWHGDTHLIADDKTNWKQKCPTFNMVISRIATYFDMDIKATRCNWYQDSSDWKPFHHDASAVKEDKAKVQNFTVGVSFGKTRDIAFQENNSRRTVAFPCPNGCAYAFCRDINVNWKHGILPIHPDNFSQEGRISIIAWGWKMQLDV